MNRKFTLVLLIVAAVLTAVVIFFFKNEQAQSGGGEEHRILAIDRDDIKSLTINSRDLKIDLEQSAADRPAVPGEAVADRWVMKSPFNDHADQALIDELMSELETSRKIESFKVKASDKDRLQEYGLQSPHIRLLINRKKGNPVELQFGSDAVFDGQTYGKIDGEDAVFVTTNRLKTLLQKDANSWRDHRVVDIPATDVSRFTIKNAFGEIELQRDGTHWKIAKPLAARGDDAKINDLVAQATNLTVEKFVGDDKADGASYGLATPRGVITLYAADNAKGTELMIGNVPAAASPAPSPSSGTSPEATPTPAPTPATSENSVYLRQPGRQSIYTVSKNIEAFLTLKPNDLRDHAFTRINADTVDRIHIAPAESAEFSLARKNKEWILNGQSVNPMGVTQLVNSLNSAQVVAFVADSAAPADLAKYGLDKPTVQVRFASFATENTAESSAGEKPVATVDFGKEDGANVYARLEEEPFIVSVPKTVLDSVWTDPLQWQPLDIFHADPEKITSLEVATKGAPALALTHGDKGEWKAKQGGLEVASAKVQSVLNTLSKLRAVRWVGGPAQPTYALNTPEKTLSFVGNTDNSANSGKLYFGARTSESMTYARVEGKPGVFLISRPDAETLLQFAPAAPTPSPAPSPVPVATPESLPTVAPASTMTPAPVPVPQQSAPPELTPEPFPPVAPMPQATPTPSPVEPLEATPVPSAAATPAPVEMSSAPVAGPSPTAGGSPGSVPTTAPLPLNSPVPAASATP